MYEPLFVYVGRVLNRFSKDIGFIDAILPYQTVDFLNVSNEKYIELSEMGLWVGYIYQLIQ